jgi:hypothetical protein
MVEGFERAFFWNVFRTPQGLSERSHAPAAILSPYKFVTPARACFFCRHEFFVLRQLNPLKGLLKQSQHDQWRKIGAGELSQTRCFEPVSSGQFQPVDLAGFWKRDHIRHGFAPAVGLGLLRDFGD